MLVITIYLGTDVYKDLSVAEIGQNYDKWKVITKTLKSALKYIGEGQ